MSESSATDCPFCRVPARRVRDSNALALLIEDSFPVSPGHALIIPRRHVASYFDLTADEVAAIHELLCREEDRLFLVREPGGYNIGINIGKVAGQTIMHVHFHLIPRYPGDVADPVGGVRNVIPGRGRYPNP